MKDLCIVGFGLAGLSVARHARLSHLDFDIISDASQLSSKVAGGIINPISVKRMKPVWQIEQFLPYAKDYYTEIENIIDTKIINDKHLWVYIHNTEQENNWYVAYDKVRLKPIMIPKLISNPNQYLNAQKIGKIDAGLVNLSELFIKTQRYYDSINTWHNHSFNYNDLQICPDHVEYDSKKYKHIVFCEGYGVVHNPFFNDLGIYGNKGDYLIIKSEHLKMKNIAKAKYFLIPLGNDLYKFGATYQRRPLNHEPSGDAKNQLIEALDKMINVSYKIVGQVCGIRPTTRDRKPILGTHQTHKNLHILNGFGSRGVLTSPLLGKKLISHIFEASPLDKETTIDRIYARI
jgi:hypothetical protein